jgi:hypothetical protein
MLYIAFTLLILWLWHYTLLRQDMAVNQNERLSHITLKNKLKQTNKVSIAVLQTATDNFEYITYLLPILCRILHVCYRYYVVFYMPVTNIVPYFTCLLPILYQACYRYLYLILHVSLIIAYPLSGMCYPRVSIFYIRLFWKKQRLSADPLYEWFEDSKGVISRRKSKDRQYCDQTKTDHYHLQNTTLKIKDLATRTAQQIEGSLCLYISVI